MGKYAKFWTALATVVVAGLVHQYGSGTGWVQLVVGALGAVGVYAVPNVV